jgi:cytochrome oxidase assembly protein ShyY1
MITNFMNGLSGAHSRFQTLWRFLLISAAALACVAVTASLGFWQLGRAAHKQAVFDAIARQQALGPGITPSWPPRWLARQTPPAKREGDAAA